MLAIEESSITHIGGLILYVSLRDPEGVVAISAHHPTIV